MVNYTIQKIENDIILTLPAVATYHNKYRDIYYLNNSKGIQIKRIYQPIATAHLESIKIEAENITSATSDDITFQFRTTTGGIVSVNCGENTSELVTNVTSQLTPQDFYLDAVGGIGNNLHIADFINTVLIDVFSNAEVLDELCADEEVVANPCPDCPECPECPECPLTPDDLFEELLPEEWITYTYWSNTSVQDGKKFVVEGVYASTMSISVEYNEQTYASDTSTYSATVEIPFVEGVTEYEVTMSDGTNTKTFTLDIQPYSTGVYFYLQDYRDSQTPADNEEQQE